MHLTLAFSRGVAAQQLLTTLMLVIIAAANNIDTWPNDVTAQSVSADTTQALQQLQPTPAAVAQSLTF